MDYRLPGPLEVRNGDGPLPAAGDGASQRPFLRGERSPAAELTHDRVALDA
jgi:hypothetical protein